MFTVSESSGHSVGAPEGDVLTDGLLLGIDEMDGMDDFDGIELGTSLGLILCWNMAFAKC